jgi:CRP-like cAMP-binding protein
MSLLHNLPVFHPLPVAPLEMVARASTEIEVGRGETVIREGDHGDRFYAVADGSFDVTIAGRDIVTIGAGGSFGEIALLADVPRTATVTATSRGALLALERDDFLLAVTGHADSRQAAWGAVGAMDASGVEIPHDIDP